MEEVLPNQMKQECNPQFCCGFFNALIFVLLGLAFLTYEGRLFRKTVTKSSIRAIKKIVIPIDIHILGIQKGMARRPGLISSKI